MTKKEKIIDSLRNVVIDRYELIGKKMTVDEANTIWYSILDAYSKGGYPKAQEYVLDYK